MRLVDGPGPWAGRLEIWFQGAWGPVCNGYYFQRQAARVVCLQLGYPGGR